MAIALESQSSAFATAVSGTITWTHTPAATGGTNLVAIVGETVYDGTDAARPLTGVTYGATAMAKIGSKDQANANITTELWYLLNPPGGAQTILATYTGTVINRMGGCVMLSGISTLTTAASTGTLNTNAPSGTGTSSADNSWAVDVVGSEPSWTGHTLTAGAGQTRGPFGTIANEAIAMSWEGPQTPAGPIVMSWTIDVNRDWNLIMGIFSPATATGGAAFNLERLERHYPRGDMRGGMRGAF